MNTLRKIRVLNHIQRCCLFPLIKPTSVAEHSFHVAIMCVFVCDELKREGKEIDELKVLKKALFHDCEETFTSDVPYTMKIHLKEKITATVNKIVGGEFPGAPTWFTEIVKEECDGSLEHWIVKLCDMMELNLYCLDEIEMGNKHVLPMLKRGMDVAWEINKNEVKSLYMADILDRIWQMC